MAISSTRPAGLHRRDGFHMCCYTSKCFRASRTALPSTFMVAEAAPANASSCWPANSRSANPSHNGSPSNQGWIGLPTREGHIERHRDFSQDREQAVDDSARVIVYDSEASLFPVRSGKRHSGQESTVLQISPEEYVPLQRFRKRVPLASERLRILFRRAQRLSIHQLLSAHLGEKLVPFF